MLTRVPPSVFSLLRFDSIRLLNMRVMIRDGVREAAIADLERNLRAADFDGMPGALRTH
jgi:hypothetical protein